jgi:L-2-hydroxyglutarate oxidase LhgO
MATPSQEYDYIIVGAGLAGLTMFRMLEADRGVDLLLSA